jgi:hypothetical protein
MIEAIEIPSEVPVMTLNSTVLLPRALMPLFIFEPRYRKMPGDVLARVQLQFIASEAHYRLARIRQMGSEPDGSKAHLATSHSPRLGPQTHARLDADTLY